MGAGFKSGGLGLQIAVAGREADGGVPAKVDPGVFLMGNDIVLAAHSEPSKHHERQDGHS